MLSRNEVLQTIKEGKEKLGINDMIFKVEYVDQESKIGKRAEIFIKSRTLAEITLYPDATLFTVRHELCHAKLFRMGISVTNTEKDRRLFPNTIDYVRIVVIVEWYINELQKRVFNEYYPIDQAGTSRPPPFEGLPKLPHERFTNQQIEQIFEIAKKSNSVA